MSAAKFLSYNQKNKGGPISSLRIELARRNPGTMPCQTIEEFKSVPHNNHTRYAVALCPPEQAALLLPYDHHTVRVDGQTGVLLTYPHLTKNELTQPVEFQIVFEHTTGHPAAPPEAQAIIDLLTFETIS